MYRSASIHVYDVMDSVHAHARVLMSDRFEPASPTVELEVSIDVQGVGSGSADAWLRDVLVALIEAT